ncbi:glycosyltransferase family 2 protein [Effusibacillus consociatus]|uniref:Glycosyltransferase family 2 protein n=1 Tax=Effusibacillus consociatus TaxID=1117041 RepID=A0ABV9PU55_9BACL
MNDLISIVIPLYNQYHVTEQCLNSIFQKTDIPYELILIDNGSTDLTREKISQLDGSQFQHLKELKIIYNQENLGVAKAWNQGIKYARGDFICICNNDIVVSKNWLSSLIEKMRGNSNLGMISPVDNVYIMSYPHRFPEEDKFLRSRLPFQQTLQSIEQFYNGFEQFAASFTEKHKSKEFFHVSFSLAIIRKQLIEEIGLFEEEMGIAFWEDVDFVQRALLNENFSEMMVYPGSYIHHYGSVTSSIFGMPQLIRSAHKFSEKWGSVGNSITEKLAQGLLNKEELHRLRVEIRRLLPFITNK